MVNDLLVTATMLHVLAGLVLATLVYQDASLRGSDRPWLFAAAAALIGLLFAIGYALYADQVGELPPPEERPRAPIGARLRDLLRGLSIIAGAFLCAVVVVSLGAPALVGAGVVARDTLEFRVVGSVLQFLGFGVAIVGYLALTDEWDLIPVRLPSLRGVGLIVVGVVALVGEERDSAAAGAPRRAETALSRRRGVGGVVEPPLVPRLDVEQEPLVAGPLARPVAYQRRWLPTCSLP